MNEPWISSEQWAAAAAPQLQAPGVVLGLHRAGQLGYLAASDEWVNGHGDPLPRPLQATATALAQNGTLPEFAEWFPAPSTDTRDIVKTITDAIGCQRCGRPLDDSPSDDFCSEVCQRDWHTSRSAAPAGLHEEVWTAPAGTPFPADPDDPAASGYFPVHVLAGDGVLLARWPDGQDFALGRLTAIDPQCRITSVTQDRAPITFTAIDPQPDADAVAAMLYDAYRQRYALGVTPAGDVIGVRPDGSVGEVDHVITNAWSPTGESPAERMLELRRREQQQAREEDREITGQCWGSSTATGDSFSLGPVAGYVGPPALAAFVEQVSRDSAELARHAALPEGWVEQFASLGLPLTTWQAHFLNGFLDGIRETVEVLAAAIEPAAEALRQLGLLVEEPPADPKARALWLRRNRNTGPARQQRAPRAITARRSR
ncbi:hypothetical protein ACVDFE_02205 [Lentzea chajnantorensis]